MHEKGIQCDTVWNWFSSPNGFAVGCCFEYAFSLLFTNDGIVGYFEFEEKSINKKREKIENLEISSCGFANKVKNSWMEKFINVNIWLNFSQKIFKTTNFQKREDSLGGQISALLELATEIKWANRRPQRQFKLDQYFWLNLGSRNEISINQ